MSVLPGRAPRHVGIIMDGNGRWARKRNRPHSFGHRAGVRAIKRVMYGCEELGVEVLSVYTFSTENWSRPPAEVKYLMRLFHEAFRRELDEIDERGIRVVVSGRRAGLSAAMQRQVAEAEGRTAGSSPIPTSSFERRARAGSATSCSGSPRTARFT